MTRREGRRDSNLERSLIVNILHMKYAVEVAQAGSLTKASDKLLIAPPNLSRSIKELEADLGITIFKRSTKGMVLTPRGEEFVHYARKILDQIDDVEKSFKNPQPLPQKFSISVPRASYISEAFSRFTQTIGGESVELYYKETNPYRAMKNILEANYGLGIIRYAEEYDKYFVDALEKRAFHYELVSRFRYVLIMSRNNPLANKDEIHYSDLQQFVEIAHADPFVPSLPSSVVRKEELPDNAKRYIFVFERGTQFDLLSSNTDTFMWVSPVPDEMLERHGLVQRRCEDNTKRYKDMLIYLKEYELTELDKRFITEVRKSAGKFM